MAATEQPDGSVVDEEGKTIKPATRNDDGSIDAPKAASKGSKKSDEKPAEE